MAQAAEIVAILQVLQQERLDQDVAIFIDSDWVTKAMVTWLHIWVARSFFIFIYIFIFLREMEPVAHVNQWQQIHSLVKQKTGQTWVNHMKAHQKGNPQKFTGITKPTAWQSKLFY